MATLFIDFWLSGCSNEVTVSCTDESFGLTCEYLVQYDLCVLEQGASGGLFASRKLWSIDSLPSKEQLRCVRLLLRHLHYFCNYTLPEDCAMNDLKRYVMVGLKEGSCCYEASNGVSCVIGFSVVGKLSPVIGEQFIRFSRSLWRSYRSTRRISYCWRRGSRTCSRGGILIRI